MNYIERVIGLYEIVSKQYKEDIDALTTTGKKKELKQLEEKLHTTGEFLNHLYIIQETIRRRFILKSQIPDFMGLKKKNNTK